jgi:hypothetical protein
LAGSKGNVVALHGTLSIATDFTQVHSRPDLRERQQVFVRRT